MARKQPQRFTVLKSLGKSAEVGGYLSVFFKLRREA